MFLLGSQLVDLFEVFYGSQAYNDIDFLWTVFDFESVMGARSPNATWFKDDNDIYSKLVSEASPVSLSRFVNQHIVQDAPAPYVQDTGSTIIVRARAKLPSYLDMRTLQLQIDSHHLRSTALSFIGVPSILPVSSIVAAELYIEEEDVRARIAAKVASDPNAGLVYMIDGIYHVVLATQLADMFSRFEYTIVGDVDFGANRGGATNVKADGTGWYSNVAPATLEGYWLNYSHDGIVYYLLHELAHNLPGMAAFAQANYTNYRNNNNNSDVGFSGIPGNPSPQFLSTERWANSVARELAWWLGFTPLTNPPGGGYP